MEDTVLDNLRSHAVGLGLEQLRALLGSFGFSGTAVDKKARVLSGGERARLALLRILVRPHNVCLLDEPTNHLDIETKEILCEAISNFEGTVIFVSHDREFVERVCDQIVYLTTDHKATAHLGDLDSFFVKYPHFVRHIENRHGPSTVSHVPTERARPTLSFEERKKIRNQIKSFDRKVTELESELNRMNEQKRSIAADLSPEGVEANTALDRSIYDKMVEWERMSTELELLRAKYES